MSQSRCPITDLLIEHCAHCRPKPAPDPFDGPSIATTPWFAARYRGECSGCDETFEEFDQIRGDGEGGYRARCCDGER